MTSPHQPFPPAPPVSARNDSTPSPTEVAARLAEAREALAAAKARLDNPTEEDTQP